MGDTEVVDTCVEKGNKQLTIDEPNRKAVKVWSEKSQRFYYRCKDPNYYNQYFHNSKREMQC